VPARWIIAALAAFTLAGCGADDPAKLVRTPRLLGLKSDAAEARILAAGLCPGGSRIDKTSNADYVIVRQVPAPGTQVAADSHVSVVIGVNGPGAMITDERGWPKRCRGY
jgi:beta-lactam-binding protein with PASTA domain